MNCKKGGVYLLQPNPIPDPPLKLGWAFNLERRLLDYHEAYPHGFKIHAIAQERVPDIHFDQHGPNFAKLAEGKALVKLAGEIAFRKEWLKSTAKAKAQKAIREIHAAQNGDNALAPFYFPGSKMAVGRRGGPVAGLTDRELASESAPPPPPAPVPDYPFKRNRVRDPAKRLVAGRMEKMTRSGLIRR
tara:strand:- start:552 stop:1115 length:564 start_codon:yes stop_codon:yes gene_type:complete